MSDIRTLEAIRKGWLSVCREISIRTMAKPKVTQTVMIMAIVVAGRTPGPKAISVSGSPI